MEVYQERSALRLDQPQADPPCTPTKSRVIHDSLISECTVDANPKTNRQPKPVQFVDDSLVVFETPNTKEKISKKRESLEPSSFLAKRQATTSVLEENSEVSLSLNVSTLNCSGLRHPVRELSFRSCSSIISDGGDSSLLRDVNPAVNFKSISFSDIQDETPLQHTEEHPIDTMDVEMNLDDMSYSALLRLEQNQKGVLDDRWREVHDDVVNVHVVDKSDS